MSYTVAFKLQVVEFADSFGNKFWMGTWILWKASARLEKEKQNWWCYQDNMMPSYCTLQLEAFFLTTSCCHCVAATKLYIQSTWRLQLECDVCSMIISLLLNFGGATYTPDQLTLWQIICRNFQSTSCFNGRECTQSSQSQKTSKSKVSERCIAATLLTQHKPFTHDVDLPLAGLHY